MSRSNEIAIHIENLSKEFKLYSRPADMFIEMMRGTPHHKSFWALQDVSFDVPRGQVVGILGRNGAGKSTLLKIISGTLDKTSGEVVTRGRISSILELGTGFNPEYTGRENIYLGGLMVGLTNSEIKAKEDWIIDFSELRNFIDQPFKTYSSGMQARLTFSTAVCVDPEILVIDEALSVGDARFQKKSFDKIREFRNAGNTILFVSHSTNAVMDICDSAILLEGGRVIDNGAPSAVAKRYWKMMFVDENPERTEIEQTPAHSQHDLSSGENIEESPKKNTQDFSGLVRAGNRAEAEVIEITIRDEHDQSVNFLTSGQKYSICVRTRFHMDLEYYGFGFHITNEKGVVVYGISSVEAGMKFPPAKKGQILEAKLNVTMWLTNGEYLLSAGVGDGQNVIDFLYDVLVFTLPRLPAIQHASVVNLDPHFDYKMLNEG